MEASILYGSRVESFGFAMLLSGCWHSGDTFFDGASNYKKLAPKTLGLGIDWRRNPNPSILQRLQVAVEYIPGPQNKSVYGDPFWALCLHYIPTWTLWDRCEALKIRP